MQNRQFCSLSIIDISATNPLTLISNDPYKCSTLLVVVTSSLNKSSDVFPVAFAAAMLNLKCSDVFLRLWSERTFTSSDRVLLIDGMKIFSRRWEERCKRSFVFDYSFH